MPEHSKGSELFIVDNSDSEWKVLQYLREWAEISHQFDVASAYFEIGSLLGMDGQWQKLDKLRILMGDEVSRRTKKALAEGIAQLEQRLEGRRSVALTSEPDMLAAEIRENLESALEMFASIEDRQVTRIS